MGECNERRQPVRRGRRCQLRDLGALLAAWPAVCALAFVLREDSLSIGAVALVVIDLPIFGGDRVVRAHRRHIRTVLSVSNRGRSRPQPMLAGTRFGYQ